MSTNDSQNSFFSTILDNSAPTLVTDLRGRIIYLNRPTLCLIERHYHSKKTSTCNVKDFPEPSFYNDAHYTTILEPLDSYEATSLRDHFMNNNQIIKEESEEDFNVLEGHNAGDPEKQGKHSCSIVKKENESYQEVLSPGNLDSLESTSTKSLEDLRSKLHTSRNPVVVVVDPCSSVDPVKNVVLISTIRDVTDSKFVEFVLNEADNRITITYDLTGLILEVSRSCKHILGFDPNELLGLDGYAYIHPDDATEVRMYHSKRASEPYGTTLQRHCFRHQRKDGTYCLLEIWSQGIQSNGQWTFVGFDITNTTESVLENRGLIPDQAIVRRKLLHNADNDTRNKVANNFVSFICHELRNPLNGIIGYITLVLDTELTKQQRDYAEAISSISNHMCNIINQSLDLCQTQSRVSAINKGTELRVKDNLTSLQKKKVQDNGNNSEIDESSVGWYGDGDTIRKILLNYLTNAIKHTGPGSVTVILEVEDDKLPDGKDGFMAKCSVEDTGPGIPQKNLKRLFLPYSKLVSSFGEINKNFNEFVDGASSRHQNQSQRSSGLGLSICKELANKIGGKVGVESALGNGSKFWFTFPIYTSMPEDFEDENDFGIVVDTSNNEIIDKERTLKDFLWKKSYSLVDDACNTYWSSDERKKILKRRRTPTADSIASIRSLSPSSSSSSRPNSELTASDFSGPGGIRKNKKPAKVLMVEDNEVNQQIAIKYLEKMGEEVTVAANGAEALEKMKKESFDILFVDLQMPIMDGYALTRRIRESEREFCHCDPQCCSLPRFASSHSIPQDLRLTSSCAHTLCSTSSSHSSSPTASVTPSSLSTSTLPSQITASSSSFLSLSNVSPDNSQHKPDETPTTPTSHQHHHRKHLPIVACTGSVLDREKDKCRQYGMDGFLTKPYRLEEMKLCIEELVDLSDDSGVDESCNRHGYEKTHEPLYITPI
ncbi:7643_t:CDS:2 [Acaulospora colombiana]|uniref:7643_t:CDS:1 n=1 Tax=Acaulospora colombiana TaxID=27376 RepID=A0ACA9JUZ7_9GLOM|nr:7643_t:CDS:2 [Acaulospora colombiana]